MRIVDWTRCVPYGSAILRIAQEEKVSATLLGVTMLSETGGLCHPFAFAPREESYGLVQSQRRYHEALWAGKPWWDPEVNLRAGAKEILKQADALGVSPRPREWRDWMYIRLAYARGPTGVRRTLGPSPTLGELLATPTAIRAAEWLNTITTNPVSGAGLGGNAVRWEPEILRPFPQGELTDWTVGQVPLVTTKWERACWQPLIERLMFRVGRETYSAIQLSDKLWTGSPLPIDHAWPRNAVLLAAQRRRLAPLLLKVGALLKRHTDHTGPLELTSAYRDPAWDRVHNPDVKHSPHAEGWACDLDLGQLNRSKRTGSVLAFGRLLAGWAFGPSLRELGGLGVYRGTPSMLHVDARPRTNDRLDRWSWNYSHVIL